MTLFQGYAAFTPKGPLLPLAYEPPAKGPYDVTVKISHVGICHTDLYMIDNAWGRSHYPLVPGHEIVGTVVEGPPTLVGKRVGISWVHTACLSCRECLQGHTNICQSKQSVYSPRPGGFASHIVVDHRFIYEIPPSLPSEYAAPLLCAGATVYAPMRRFGIQPSHAVAIVGIGGLGHLALSLYRAFGCEVFAISSSEEKRKDALSLGADDFFSPSSPPPQSRFDYILYTSEAPLDAPLLFSSLRPNGTLCLLSRPPPCTLDPKLLVSQQKTLSSSNNADRATLQEMLFFADRHKIYPKIELFPLSQIEEALRRLRAQTIRYRAVVYI